MRLLEHQSRKLLADYGLSFTPAAVVSSSTAAAEEAGKLGSAVMLKAQVPFGGRGKAGAVLSADIPEEAAAVADQLLGRQLRGVTVTCLSVERKVSFLREFYVGVTWATASKLPVALLGPAGGVLTGSGTISGNVTVGGGRVSPGSHTGAVGMSSVPEPSTIFLWLLCTPTLAPLLRVGRSG